MKLNIKLGENLSEPSGPKDRVYYPELHVTKDEPIDFPKEGVMKIRYKKTSSGERDGKYSCTFEVHELVSVEGDKDVEQPTRRDRSAEEALDRLAAEKSKSNSDEGDY